MYVCIPSETSFKSIRFSNRQIYPNIRYVKHIESHWLKYNVSYNFVRTVCIYCIANTFAPTKLWSIMFLLFQINKSNLRRKKQTEIIKKEKEEKYDWLRTNDWSERKEKTSEDGKQWKGISETTNFKVWITDCISSSRTLVLTGKRLADNKHL